MSCPALSHAFPADDRLAVITAGLADRGWVVLDDFVSAEWAAELREEQQRQYRSGTFRRAGTGRVALSPPDSGTRGDEILWLDGANALPAQCQYLMRLEDLRSAVNRDLFLGLHEFETHATVYPPGSFYVRHLDGFRHGNRRVLSVILYLDPRWHDSDGGTLRLFHEAGPDSGYLDVLPESGRLVAFLSERFLHEVRVTRRTRSSITSWFLRRLP